MGLKGFLNNFPPCTQLFESAHLKFKKTTPLCTIIKPCLLITLKKKDALCNDTKEIVYRGSSISMVSVSTDWKNLRTG